MKQVRYPGDWQQRRLKFVAGVSTSNVDKHIHDDEIAVRLCNYTDVYYNRTIHNELELTAGSVTPLELKRFGLRRGQVLMTKDSESWDDIAVPAHVAQDMPEVVCGYHLAVVEPLDDELDGEFFCWAAQTDTINDHYKLEARGVTRFGLGHYALKNVEIGYPSLDKQNAINVFLRHKTAEIDDLIAKKRSLLMLLAEKRSALITRAVTKGLDPTAPMKPSGIDWLGDIPVHWDVLPLWVSIAKLESGVSVNSMDTPAIDDELGILKTSCVYSGEFDAKENKIVFDPIEIDRLKCPVRRGEIIISRMNTPELVGAAGLVRAEHSNLFLPDRLWQTSFASEARLQPEFVFLYLSSALYRARISSLATGSSPSMKNISKEDFQKMKVATPPLDEQRAIIISVSVDVEEIAKSAGLVQQAIDSLTEYRAAIITKAVTGELEVS